MNSSSSSYGKSSSSSLGESSSSSSYGKSSSSSLGESSSSSLGESSSSSSYGKSSSSSLGESSSSSLGESSSSSSYGYTSSSSSSLWDKSEARLIPFTIEEVKSNPTWTVAFYGDYAFAGTGDEGEILRSNNRYNWGVYYKTNDLHVSALYVDNGYLYAGTAPKGIIYRFKMSNNTTTSYGEFGSNIVDFAKYGDDLFVATESGNIYKFDSVNDQWNFEYKAYGEVTEMDVIHSLLYVAVKGENIVAFDGSNWDIVKLGEYNIGSLRNVTGEISFVDFSALNRSSTINPTNDAEIYEIYPQHKSVGISCIEQDGTSIVMGSSNKARVYSLLNDELKLLFDTNSNNVYDILNIDVGVNLAAIDNKLYLIHCGDLGSLETEAVTVSTENLDSSSESDGDKTVILTYPNGGEQFELGQEITIQWSSTRNQNDAIKLDLYSSEEFLQTIANQTTNDGQFTWTIPLSLDTGSNYKIYIEWLSAGTVAEEDKDLSDGTFSFAFTTTTTTTTTTTAANPQEPDTSSCRGIPILILPEDEYITSMANDNTLNSVLLTTSTGRILECKESVINGYLTGERTVWATVKDGMGISNVASTQYMYALYNRIAEVNEEKEIVKWKYVEKPAAIPFEKIHGIFISPVLYVQEDIGTWKTLLWNETKSDEMEIIVRLRAANSTAALENSDWSHSFKSTVADLGAVTRDLSNVHITGQYMQIKVDMSSESNLSPAVSDVTIVYTTQEASYFFTTRFSLENGSDINTGLVIAEITEPVNTEVQMGICNFESSDWNDYQIVPYEKFFSISDFENMKVGLRFITYDDTNIPSASGFSIIFSGDKVQTVDI